MVKQHTWFSNIAMFFVTVYASIVLFGLLCLFIPVAYILSLFNSKKEETWSDVGEFVIRTVFTLCGVKIKVYGQKNIPKGTVVFAANHLSLIDGFVLFYAIPQYSSAMTAPFKGFPRPIGFWFKKAGYVDVYRDHTDNKYIKSANSKKKAIILSVEKLKAGKSMIMFPEGHLERGYKVFHKRVGQHRLMYFHTGAVRIALAANVNIIPVGIEGDEQVFPPYGKQHFSPGTIRVKFGKLINLKKYYNKQENRRLVVKLTVQLKRKVSKLLSEKYLPDGKLTKELSKHNVYKNKRELWE